MKREQREIKPLEDMKDNTTPDEPVYFIEHKETRLWWAGQDEKTDTPVWTNDPVRAYPFDDKTFASIRAWAYSLGEITEITEHLFVNQ
jgi:hypothetical protein